MSFETIRAKDISNYIGQRNVIIIDIRDNYDYRRGHIPTAINIPYEEFEYKKNLVSSNNELILYCERGNNSLLLARDLEKDGYKVKSIYGGIQAYRGSISRDSY